MVPDPGRVAVAVKLIEPPAIAYCGVAGLRVTDGATTFTVVGAEVAFTPPPPS